MSGSGDDQDGDTIYTGQSHGRVAVFPNSSGFPISHLPVHNEYPHQLLGSFQKGQATPITHLVPATSGDTHTPTLALSLYHLSLVLLAVRPGVLQPASRIFDLEVAIQDGAVKKFGNFADIYQGHVLAESSDIPIPNTIAVKLLRLNLNGELITQMSFSAEVSRRVWSHPNICPLWSLSLVADAKPAVAMPWFCRGNILDWSRQNLAFNKLVAVQQIAAAISYLHAADAVHGNITPSNIMVADDGRACLTDVGLHVQLSKLTYNGAWPIPHDWMHKAPEELLPQCDPLDFVPTKAMDVYAFASTTYTIFTSRPPFNVQSYSKGLLQILSHGHVLEKPAQVTDTLWTLLRRCWAPLPKDRPVMARVEAELVAM